MPATKVAVALEIVVSLSRHQWHVPPSPVICSVRVTPLAAPPPHCAPFWNHVCPCAWRGAWSSAPCPTTACGGVGPAVVWRSLTRIFLCVAGMLPGWTQAQRADTAPLTCHVYFMRCLLDRRLAAQRRSKRSLLLGTAAWCVDGAGGCFWADACHRDACWHTRVAIAVATPHYFFQHRCSCG
jgi:hypothetical protein